MFLLTLNKREEGLQRHVACLVIFYGIHSAN